MATADKQEVVAKGSHTLVVVRDAPSRALRSDEFRARADWRTLLRLPPGALTEVGVVREWREKGFW